MAMTQEDSADETRLFELRPNAGVYWRQTVIIFLMLSLVCLGIAIAFAFAGFWPILPFAGLEVMALGAALYVSARRGHYREVIRVTPTRVLVEKGWRRPEQSWEFNRAWTEVQLERSPLQWYPARLTIRSGSERIECGAFLTDEERESLARELLDCIGPMTAVGGADSRRAGSGGE